MTGVYMPLPAVAARPPAPARWRMAVGGAAVAIVGAAPHVLHHAGPLAGAALFAGLGGSLLFGAIGFVVAIPFLDESAARSSNTPPGYGILEL